MCPPKRSPPESLISRGYVVQHKGKICVLLHSLTHLPEPLPLPEGGGEPAVHPDPGRPPLAQLAGPNQARTVRGVVAVATRGHISRVRAGHEVAPTCTRRRLVALLRGFRVGAGLEVHLKITQRDIHSTVWACNLFQKLFTCVI